MSANKSYTIMNRLGYVKKTKKPKKNSSQYLVKSRLNILKAINDGTGKDILAALAKKGRGKK